MKAIFVGGKLDGEELDVDEIYWMEGLWNGCVTRSLAKERAEGRLCPRAELDNQPKCNGYLGPMWDGDKLRYESHDVYDRMSN